MTERKIVIKTCKECPYRFKFMKQDYYPSYCKRAGKSLEYEISNNEHCAQAEPTYEIPEWCPLEENK